MKNCCYLALALLLLVITPVTAADMSTVIIVDEEFSEYHDTSCSGEQTTTGSIIKEGAKLRTLTFKDITNATELFYIVMELPGAQGAWVENGAQISPGRYDFTYSFNGRDRPGVLYLDRHTDLLGRVTKSRFTMLFNDWDIGQLSGEQSLSLPFYIYQGEYRSSGMTIAETITPTNVYLPGFPRTTIAITECSARAWKNHLQITETGGAHEIILNRTVGNTPYTSTIQVLKNDITVYTSTHHGFDEHLWYGKSDADRVIITSPAGNAYDIPMTPTDDPDVPGDPDASVTVYVKNSQTGALIADANVVIDALVDGEYYQVTNRTEPSGIFTITLQPTGGGKPNPDSYRLIVTADGYNNPMPEINFTVDDYKNYIHCLLDPIAGGPVNENKTFIDFFVRDMSSNPISGATVKFGKYTLITNNAGYTVFEVDKNNNYTWTVSKSGYGPLTGNAVIGDDPRHTINTVLAPVVTPTQTTPIPTSSPIGPTPTMTAPTGEPVSNWLEWFAAHFGMILGGGVEIGKIFMWLCFTVPVGVYVGKEAKAGAAGFMAGAGIVTLFFVLIGWVPIWLVVLLALIIGLLYAKVFNTQDNGGGR